MHRKHVCLKWVPHELTDVVRGKRVADARDLLEHLQGLGPIQANRVITGDQSWVFVRNQPDGCWLPDGETIPTRERRTIGDEKVMLTVLFSRQRIWVVNFLPDGKTFDSAYMVDEILRMLDEEVRKTSPTMGLRGWRIHLDNSKPHRANATRDAMTGLGLLELPHPPYSPDIAPSDFALFGWLKGQLAHRDIANRTELERAIRELLAGIPETWFLAVWEEWEKRLEWVVENNGEYFVR